MQGSFDLSAIGLFAILLYPSCPKVNYKRIVTGGSKMLVTVNRKHVTIFFLGIIASVFILCLILLPVFIDTRNYYGRINEAKKYQEQANSNGFIPPSKSKIAEERFEIFLNIRKRIYPVYVKNNPAQFTDPKWQEEKPGKLDTIYAELKFAKSKAQAELGMNDGEYIFIETTINADPNTSTNITVDPNPSLPRGYSLLEINRVINQRLFDKYEAEMKRYEMPGLEELLRIER
jgi:hypothetical protein